MIRKHHILHFNSQEEYDQIMAKLKTYCFTMQDVFRIGFDRIDEIVDDINGADFVNGSVRAYIYYRPFNGKKLSLRVVDNGGQKKNLTQIQIYRMIGMTDDKVRIVYKEAGSNEFKSVIKGINKVDNSLLSHFF